jgi:hypothetical protein
MIRAILILTAVLRNPNNEVGKRMLERIRRGEKP